jgi:hypothetical protein
MKESNLKTSAFFTPIFHTYFSKSYKNNPTMKRWRVGIPLSIFGFKQLQSLYQVVQLVNGILTQYLGEAHRYQGVFRQ